MGTRQDGNREQCWGQCFLLPSRCSPTLELSPPCHPYSLQGLSQTPTASMWENPSLQSAWKIDPKG